MVNNPSNSRIIISIIDRVLGVALTLIGSFIIGITCHYSTSAGPMNMDVSFIYSIIGFVLLFFGILLLKRNLNEHIFIFKIYMMILSILLICFGLYVQVDSKIKLLAKTAQYSEFIDVIEPCGFNLLILYGSFLALFFYAIFLNFGKAN